MHILVSNDDGVHAPGIKSLSQYLKANGEVIVVAPLEERSATGHTLSLDNPLRVVEVSGGVYGCSGFPADCTLVALRHLLKEKSIRPDLMVSGVNRGANLGQDIYYSGTVAAAREAAFHGIPSLAVSLTIDFNENKEKINFFDTASAFVSRLISMEIDQFIPPMTVLNINVPNVPAEKIEGVVLTELGFRHYSEKIEERRDFRGKPYYWVAGIYEGHEEREGTDCFTVEKNMISLSLLNLLGQPTDNRSDWSQLINQLNR